MVWCSALTMRPPLRAALRRSCDSVHVRRGEAGAFQTSHGASRLVPARGGGRANGRHVLGSRGVDAVGERSRADRARWGWPQLVVFGAWGSCGAHGMRVNDRPEDHQAVSAIAV